MKSPAERPGPGQESVWAYPRPPALEMTKRHVRIVVNGKVVAETHHPALVKETSHPPVYFIPPYEWYNASIVETPGMDPVCHVLAYPNSSSMNHPSPYPEPPVGVSRRCIAARDSASRMRREPSGAWPRCRRPKRTRS